VETYLSSDDEKAVDDPVLLLIYEELGHDFVRRKRFLDKYRERYATNWTHKHAQARWAQWFNPDDRHEFPVKALVLVLDTLQGKLRWEAPAA